MGRSFEDILEECIASVAEGRRTVADCLALYPQWAGRLEPLLRLATELHDAYEAQPAPARQAEARRLFLAAARDRGRPVRGPRRPALAIPRFRLPQRLPAPLVAALATVVLAFFAFSSFLFVTSGDAVPGDWRYTFKRTSERVRFAFVFGEDARRSFRIGLAEERLQELQALAASGRTIDEPAIRELVSHTEPLVEALNPQDPVAVPQDHVQRIEELTAKEREVLDQVEPLIEEEASDDLLEAKKVSTEGQARALTILSLAPSQEEQVTREETPAEGATAPAATATAEGSSAAAATARATATPSGEVTPTTETEATPAGRTRESTPAAQATPTPGREGQPTATPGATPEATPTPSVTREVIALPEDRTGHVGWRLVTIGDFSARVPNHQENGWIVSNLNLGQPRELLLIGHRGFGGFDTVVTIEVASGEASIYAFIEGVSRTIESHDVAAMVPSAAEIVTHILENISTGSP